jgi:hypothetical protein
MVNARHPHKMTPGLPDASPLVALAGRLTLSLYAVSQPLELEKHHYLVTLFNISL